MKRKLLALAVTAVTGRLSFADHPRYPHNNYYYLFPEVSEGRLAMEFMYGITPMHLA